MSTMEDAVAKRSYRQYCGLARALEIVGERWSLLIVRELLAGPARYGELRHGLPGIATNLLAERLRDLEAAGVVQRQLGTDGKGVVYALTPWGSELRNVMAALVQWSTPLMVPGPGEDTFQPGWLAVALELVMHDRRTEAPATVGVEVEDMLVTVRVDETGAHAEADGSSQPDSVLRAEPAVLLGLASGMLTVEQAIAAGEFHGRKDDLAAVFSSDWPPA